MPGSGKSVISRVAADMEVQVVRMGDVIREEAIRRGESPGLVAVKLRQEYGEFVVAQRCVDIINNSRNKKTSYLIEGIRSPFEVEIFQDYFPDFRVIAVHSKPKTRFKRLKRRKRSDDSSSQDEFVSRDQRELKFGIGDVIALADYMVVNEGSLGKIKKLIRSILKNELQN
jgi:dephospho-CoA kinase